ncbi:ATP-binding protein [Flavobacterium sp. KACC 22763]|uniref:ATP-binding protein n=1 Tax=Flavobacterium sp. KACC 22763 TaxID=3025668 RepID=UPI002367227F|nr:ATP-binding protein [Flavobacterium sp. KACC 22763]WDF63307.1 tetratricopeptide repeat protein [Flavobacterium sp. KACC 22763]
MKKNCIILFLFCFVLSCVNNKDSKNIDLQKDSLAIYLSKAKDVNLSLEYKKNYNKKALEIILDQKDDSINKVNLFKVANRYYNMSGWKEYFLTTKLILERSIDSKDSVNMAKAYSYLGDYYVSKSISDSAFLNYFKAEKIYLKINDKINLAKIFLNKGNLQFNGGDYFESEISVFKALRILKQEKNVNDLLYDCYNLLGLLYNEREEYQKAFEFHYNALNILDDKSIPTEFQLKATSLNNIGYVNLKKGDYRNAKIYFQKALDEENLYRQNKELYAIILDNLAYSKFRLRETGNLFVQFDNALKIRDTLELKSGVVLSKLHLSEYFAYKKDTLVAIEYCNQALVLSRKSNQIANTLDVLKQIALIDPENASKYSREYIKLNDQMLKAERKMGEKFSRIEYETNEIKDQNSNLEEKNKTLIYVFSICTLLGLFFYVYKTQQAKNRELLFKQQQQIANEDIYNLMISQQNEIELTRIKEKKKVAQELHDGVLGRMFGIRISLDSLDKLNESEAIAKRKKYLDELKNVEQDIREISHDLNREKSELINNFVSILNKLFEDQRNTYSSKLITVFDPEIKWDLISNIEKINLYRIVQEGLQNCNKYAKADIIKVEFKNENDSLVLIIEDDGIGFKTNKTKNGIGLNNIEYRATECKGTVTIKSAKGEGTILTIKVPIEPNNNLHNDI